jgi:peptide chain release factor 2
LWQNAQEASRLFHKREVLKETKNNYALLEKEFFDSCQLWDLAYEENDDIVQKEILSDLKNLCAKSKKYQLELFFNREEDHKACFLSVQSGSGGTEAQDWSAMLLRMYIRWAEHHHYKVDCLDESPGEEAGIKSGVIKISGKKFPYGWLKGETGVHRLVRISPFDSNARRHTSFSSISVIPEIGEDVVIDIQEKDLRIDTYRASGAGGQHVNKTDSAVRITHIPTGTIVQCQQDRSQHKNRSIAMNMLRAKLYEKEQEKKKEIETMQRQNEKGITWGQQIRSYVLKPYQMVKDLRTNFQSSNPKAILDGDIDGFLVAFLEMQAQKSPT